VGLPKEANDRLGSAGGDGGAAGILAKRDLESFIVDCILSSGAALAAFCDRSV